MTLANEFQDDSYFEAYLHCVDERQRAAIEGRDPKEVEFIPSLTEGEDASDGDHHGKPNDHQAQPKGCLLYTLTLPTKRIV